jgi:lysophospholipase L1-like esterase
MSRRAFTLVLGLAALFASCNGVAEDASVAAGPTPYPKDAKDWPGKGAIRVFGWMNDNRKSFWLERERKQGSVVFAGDSLVGGWRFMAQDLAGLPVANRGIGGEVTRGLLFRFQEDVLDLHPKAIVLLTGTNDLSAQQDIRQARSNIAEMLDMAERAWPGVPVVLCTLPPRQHPQSPIDPRRLVELNQLIAALPQGREHVAVLDVYALLADPDGAPHAEYFGADKLHISAAGYQRIRDALVPLLKRLNVG